MPKDRRDNSSSLDRATVSSPYACSLNNSDQNNYDSSSPPAGNEAEWEEARCPICIEHPHNAVLLLCSSQDKGCRPFMCDTSYRHSNCLDQFCRSSAPSSLYEQQNELSCPLCRGRVTGWVVVEAARSFMNSKTRNCSLESCDFTGNYIELRKHARVEHPSDRPSEASLTRQSNWWILEQQRNIEDLLAHQSDMEYGFDEWPGIAEIGEDGVASNGGTTHDGLLELSEIDDDDGLLGGILGSFLFLSSTASDDEEMDSGSAESSDISTNSVSLPNSSPRSTFHNENGQTVPRSTTRYQRENNVTNSGSRPNNSSLRSSNRRDYSSTAPRPRSYYYRGDYVPTSSRRRSSYHHRENGLTRSRSSYHHRENGSTSSRSSYHRENGSTGSRYYRRENGSTGSRSSYYRRENNGSGSSARSYYCNRRDTHPSSGTR